jgi:hypothetical protein
VEVADILKRIGDGLDDIFLCDDGLAGHGIVLFVILAMIAGAAGQCESLREGVKKGLQNRQERIRRA